MFAAWRTTAHSPGLDADRILAAKFLSGGRSCTPRELLGARDWNSGLVRRPFMGLKHKERSTARLWVENARGTDVLLPHQREYFTEAPHKLFPYSSFFLTSVKESRSEKTQIVETFGDPKVLFFGERPQINVFSGVLLNAENFPWRTQFWQMYDQYLRGTQCARNNAIVSLIWDDLQVQGYMLQAEAQEMADAPFMVSFSFAFLVTDWVPLQPAATTKISRWAEHTGSSPLEHLIGDGVPRAQQVMDASTRRWIIMSPALQAWISAGGIAKLVRMLRELGVPGLDGEEVQKTLEYLSNPLAAAQGDLTRAVGEGNMQAGMRAYSHAEGAMDRLTGGRASAARQGLMQNVVCANASFSRLMYGASELIANAIAPIALTVGGVRRLAGGRSSIGESLNDWGRVTHSLEKYPGAEEWRAGGQATWSGTASAWEGVG